MIKRQITTKASNVPKEALSWYVESFGSICQELFYTETETIGHETGVFAKYHFNN